MNLESMIGGLIQFLPDGLVLLDPSGLIQYMNPSAESLTETGIDEARYRHWRDVFSVKVEDTARDQTGSLIDILLERPMLITKSGRAIPIELEIVPVANETGAAIGSMLILHDVTSSNTEKEGLKESRAKYKRLVNTIEGVVWEAEGEDIRMRFVSDYAEKLLGYPAKAWVKDPGFWRSILHPEDRASVLDIVTQAIRQREDYQIEYRVLTANGSTLMVRDSVTLNVMDGQLRISGVMMDITNAKQARDALIKSEERFSAAFYANPLALLLITDSGRIVDANESFERLTGFFREELLQQTLTQSGFCSEQEFRLITQQTVNRERIENVRFPTRSRTGEARELNASLSKIKLNDEPCLLVVFH